MNRSTIISSTSPIFISSLLNATNPLSHVLHDGSFRSLACSAEFSFLFSRSDSFLEAIAYPDHLSFSDASRR